jgi:hypothetical protein
MAFGGYPNPGRYAKMQLGLDMPKYLDSFTYIFWSGSRQKYVRSTRLMFLGLAWDLVGLGSIQLTRKELA